MDGNNLQNVRADVISADVISQIFNFIILEEQNFHSFSFMFVAWVLSQSRQSIKDVLERLNWDALYQFFSEPFEVVRDKFYDFIQYAVRNDVEQAKFFNSTRNLLLRQDVEHHLFVLSDLSGNHSPSRFSYLFFKAIYRTFERDQTAEEMSVLLNTTHLKDRIIEQINFLCDMYFGMSESDNLLPVYKFCPNARNPDPIYQIEGLPLGDEQWFSLYPRTIEEDYNDDSHPWGKSITIKHMWDTKCVHCKLQITLFKVLLCSVQP